MESIRDFLAGIKMYLTLLAGSIALIVSWAEGVIDLPTLIIGIITAIAAAFGKAGMNRTEKKVDKALNK